MLCQVKQVSEVKHLLTLMPMWANFSAYCLVQATGNTSFIEQSSNLDGDFIGLFFIFQSLMRLIIQFPFGLEKVRQRCGPLGRIGAGMVCCIFCCIVAWIVEIRRIHLIDRHDLDKTIPMSVYSLLPQFLLFGLMEGLAEEGLHEFVNDHIPDSMRRYGPAFNEFVLGFGYFLSIPCLFLFRRWFQDYSTKKSHLERYFLFLAIFSTMCLCIYLYALPKYAQMEEIPSEDMEMELHKDLEDGADDSTESKTTKSSSSTRWRKLANVTTATRRFYSPLATETGTGSTTGHYPESMEEIPLQSHSYTEDEELVPDDEPGSLQYQFVIN
jgi:peptide/histidine transporter 3/4